MKKSFAGFLRAGAIAAALLFSTNVFAATALDPTKPGQYNAAFSEYKFAAKIDPLVTQFARTEIWARIWYPSNKSSKSPLVVILHGNHNTCGRSIGGGLRLDDRNDYTTTGKCPAGYVVTPNHAGYDYVAKQLATNGYIVVSINANRGITAMGEDPRENDPGLIQRRGRMILRHMMLLSQWSKNGGQPGSIKYNLKGRIDFSKVTIMGHSRGGDAVVSAFNLYKTPAWKQRVPGVKFVGVGPLAPTDFQVNSPAVIGAPLSVLLPMCDGDVNRLSGIHFYDRSVLATTPDTKNNYKAVFGTWGANHNGYNTQWQVDDQYPKSRTCPNQNKLFATAGLNPSQQAIGRYYLMALVRGNSETKAYDQVFNPAFVMPPGLKSQTRIDRSFFSGRGTVSKRLVRFDATCSSKVSVTAGVSGAGVCSTVPEHNTPTPAAIIRWGAPASQTVASSFAIFTVNNGAAINLGAYDTLDMRVAPDCFRVGTPGQSNFGCSEVTRQGGGIGAQNIGVTLQDANNKFSKTLLLSAFIERRQAVGSDFAGQSPGTPLFHALFSSARIPLTAFNAAGFNRGSVKKIWLTLAQATPTGGLFFGDIWAVSVKNNAVQDKPAEDGDEAVVASADTMVVVASADDIQPVSGLTPPRNIEAVPAQDGPAADGPAPQADAAAAPGPAADAGSSILSVERTTLKVKTGVTSDDADAAPTREVAAVAFTIATREQIVEGDALMSIRVGNALIPARRFVTGRENDTPSVIKLVIPADAVNAAADGAAFAVVSGGRVYHLGALSKGAIR